MELPPIDHVGWDLMLAVVLSDTLSARLDEQVELAELVADEPHDVLVLPEVDETVDA